MGKSLEFLEFLTYAEFIMHSSIEQDVELENVIWLYKFRDSSDMVQTRVNTTSCKNKSFFEVPIHNYFTFRPRETLKLMCR